MNKHKLRGPSPNSTIEWWSLILATAFCLGIAAGLSGCEDKAYPLDRPACLEQSADCRLD